MIIRLTQSEVLVFLMTIADLHGGDTYSICGVALNDEEYQKKRDKFPKDEFYFVDKYDYGISEENVQQAIDILNNNPYLEKRKSDVNWKNNF